MRRRLRILGAIISILVISLSGCGKEDSSTETGGKAGLVTVRDAIMTGTITQYTALIGKEKGIFEKNGINLEITEYAAGVNTMDAVVSGQADIGNMADYAAVNRLGNTLDTNNLVIVSEIQGGSTKGYLYTAPEYVDNLEALSGKGFVNQVGTVFEYYNSLIFDYLKFDESKQKLVNSDGTSTSLALAQSGDAAAVYASGSSSSYYDSIGWKQTLSAADLGIETYSYYMTTNDYNKEHTKELANFLKATQESFEYMMNNLDESAEYLEETLGISADDFKNEWAVAKSRIGFSQEGVDQLNKMEQWALQRGKFDKDYAISDYINTDALKLVYPEKVTINQ